MVIRNITISGLDNIILLMNVQSAAADLIRKKRDILNINNVFSNEITRTTHKSI